MLVELEMLVHYTYVIRSFKTNRLQTLVYTALYGRQSAGTRSNNCYSLCHFLLINYKQMIMSITKRIFMYDRFFLIVYWSQKSWQIHHTKTHSLCREKNSTKTRNVTLSKIHHAEYAQHTTYLRFILYIYYIKSRSKFFIVNSLFIYIGLLPFLIDLPAGNTRVKIELSFIHLYLCLISNLTVEKQQCTEAR